MTLIQILLAFIAFAVLGGIVGFIAWISSRGEELVAKAPIRSKALSHPENSKRKVAQIHCAARPDDVATLFSYSGYADCGALFRLYGGNLACKFACLNLGSCIRACPEKAIRRTPEGLVQVDRKRCTGCGVCLGVCPVDVIRMIPADADFIVACSSRDAPEAKKALCPVSCTACGICRDKSPDGGFMIEHNLASVDYHAHGERVYAYVGCPTTSIRPADDLKKKFDKEFAETENTGTIGKESRTMHQEKNE
jgi:Na+-translocating ferredoxin:NAD+ oxidoreductase subunit B